MKISLFIHVHEGPWSQTNVNSWVYFYLFCEILDLSDDWCTPPPEHLVNKSANLPNLASTKFFPLCWMGQSLFCFTFICRWRPNLKNVSLKNLWSKIKENWGKVFFKTNFFLGLKLNWKECCHNFQIQSDYVWLVIFWGSCEYQFFQEIKNHRSKNNNNWPQNKWNF